jgi:putative ABC transport system permease protein
LSAIIALRSIIGRPFRTLFTIAGIALALPLVLFGLFWFDAIDYMIDVSFGRIERGDAFVSFSAPVPATAIYELRAIPGILAVEGQRIVPVLLRNGHRRYRTALSGLEYGTELKVLRNADLEPIAVPLDGLMLSRPLAKTLGLSEGDTVTIEILDGTRPVRDLQVVKLSEDILGFSATMDLTALNRLLGDGDVVNAAALKVDPVHADAVWRRIQETPKIEASSVKALWLNLFNETIAGLIMVSAFVLTGFGLLIAIGVVYNSAQTAFHERAWELASLRILGFTRNEVSLILISELAVEVLLAIPLGLLVGRLLIEVIVALRVQESFQIPAIIEPTTYALAALIVLAAALASAFAIRRRIDRLDLVTVLKTRG